MWISCEVCYWCTPRYLEFLELEDDWKVIFASNFPALELRIGGGKLILNLEKVFGICYSFNVMPCALLRCVLFAILCAQLQQQITGSRLLDRTDFRDTHSIRSCRSVAATAITLVHCAETAVPVCNFYLVRAQTSFLPSFINYQFIIFYEHVTSTAPAMLERMS